MDPDPMPWRAIDAASPAAAEAPAPGRPAISRPTIAVIGAAGLLAVAAFLMAFGSGGGGAVQVAGGGEIGDPLTTASAGASRSEAPGGAAPELVVEITGAVARPGVYHLATGSRVADLLTAAGGFGPRVDVDGASRALNLAERLADGDQIRVPSRDDPPGSGSGSGPVASAGAISPEDGAPLDLNTATSAELDALPGIGPATAGKILAAREEARFTSVDDLQARKLVGEKTFEGLRELVTVR
jgi:competence protein ComEA